MACHTFHILIVKDGRGGLAAIGTIQTIDLFKCFFMCTMELLIEVFGRVLLEFVEIAIDQLALTLGFIEI